MILPRTRASTKFKLDPFDTFTSHRGNLCRLSGTPQSKEFRLFSHFVIEIVLEPDGTIGIRSGQQHYIVLFLRLVTTLKLAESFPLRRKGDRSRVAPPLNKSTP